MKKVSFIILLTLIISRSFCQTGIGTNTVNDKAMLEIRSSSKGFLPPRMSQAEILQIANPENGMMAFCNDCNSGAGCLQIYENSGWQCFGSRQMYADQTSCGSNFNYGFITLDDNTQWLDRNLGASRMAQSSNDFQAYGSLFQWGRYSDGHQCINWSGNSSGTPQEGSTAVQCTSNNPLAPCSNSSFVTGTNWTTSASQTSWWNGSSKGTADPCPSGYRIPSISELTNLNSFITSVFGGNSNGFFTSPLKMTTAGSRNASNGNINTTAAGTTGNYWSSTYSGTSDALFITFSSSGSSAGNIANRAQGYSVRCIIQ